MEVSLSPEVSILPGARVTDSSEPLDVGAGNRTLDLRKHMYVFITTSPAPMLYSQLKEPDSHRSVSASSEFIAGASAETGSVLTWMCCVL